MYISDLNVYYRVIKLFINKLIIKILTKPCILWNIKKVINLLYCIELNCIVLYAMILNFSCVEKEPLSQISIGSLLAISLIFLDFSSANYLKLFGDFTDNFINHDLKGFKYHLVCPTTLIWQDVSSETNLVFWYNVVLRYL